MAQLPLLLIEAVKVIRAQFKGCGHMQKVGSASSQRCGGLVRQLACPLNDRFRYRADSENPVAHISFEVNQ